MGAGSNSSVRCGGGNSATGVFSSSLGGCNNVSSCSYSFSGNGFCNTTASIYGTGLNGKFNAVCSLSVSGSVFSGFGNIVNANEFGLQKVSAPSFINSGVMNYIGNSTVFNGLCVAGGGTCLVIGSNVVASFSAGNTVLYYNCLDSRPFSQIICSSTLSGGCTVLATTGSFGSDGLSCGYVRNLTTGVAGGNGNFILGGVANTITAGESNLILDGVCNRITGSRALIGSGTGNVASGSGSVLISGLSNSSSGYNGVVINGNSVTGSGSFSFIGNGNPITVSSFAGFAGTGRNNVVSSQFGTIVNGQSNSVCTCSLSGAILGGTGNVINSCCNAGALVTDSPSFIGGGAMNYIGNTKIYCGYCYIGNCLYICGDQTADFPPATNRNITFYNNCDKLAYNGVACTSSFNGTYTEIVLLAGASNLGTNGIVNGYLRNLNQGFGGGSISGGVGSVLSGGFLNTVSGTYNSILGGFRNVVCCTAIGSSVIGGICNTASASCSVVVSGFRNSSSGIGSFTGGGERNIAQGVLSFIGGGEWNNVCNSTSACLALGSVVVGGVGNNTSGGTWDLATCSFTVAPTICNAGQYSFVGGGFQNRSGGDFSFNGGGGYNNICNTTSCCSLGAVVVGGVGNNTTGGFFNVINCAFSGQTLCNAGAYSFIGSGFQNRATENSAVVISGTNNTSSGCCSFVGTGQNNAATVVHSFVGNGVGNSATGNRSFIGSGANNIASGLNSIVGNGSQNTVSSYGGAILGGRCNVVAGSYSTIVGGSRNIICNSASNSFLGGGECNTVVGIGSVIVGGCCNSQNFFGGGAFIGAGCFNSIQAYTSFIGSGTWNTVCNGTPEFGAYSAVVSGVGNNTTGGTWVGGITSCFTVAPTPINLVGCHSFIGSGFQNRTIGNSSAIIGGNFNLALGNFSVIGGGFCNNICNNTQALIDCNRCLALGSVVVGGVGNNTSGGTWDLATCSFTVAPTICNAGQYSFVGGGFQNDAVGNFSVSVGGCSNTASGLYGVTVGGECNTASACYSIVVGGCLNQANGIRSSVIGGTSNNTCSFADAHIVGTNINATQACTTFVNCLSAQNLTAGCMVCVATNGVIVNAPVNAAGYTLLMGYCDTTLTASTTWYTGIYFGSSACTASVPNRRILVPQSGKLVSVAMTTSVQGTKSSASPDVTMRIRNITSATNCDYATGAFFASGGLTTCARQDYYSFTGTGLNVTAGDLLEMQIITPAWVTAPANVFQSFILYIRP